MLKGFRGFDAVTAQRRQTEINRILMYRDGTINSIKKSDEDDCKRFSKSETEVLNDMLQKGEISDNIVAGYGAGSVPLSFTKTGKEIKEKIPSILAGLESAKVATEVQLNALQQQVGFAPDQPNSRKYSKTVSYLRYAYDKAEPSYLGNNSYAEKTPGMDAACKYNSLIWIYDDILDDIDATNTILANVEDGKKYTLSVSQLIALNFK